MLCAHQSSKNYNMAAFNLSEVDFDLYVAANTAVQAGLLVIIVLPALTLCIVCSMAISFTYIINWQLRVALVNIFLSEVILWLGYTVDYIGFAPRALDKENSIFSCRVYLTFLVTGSMQKFPAVTLYSIMVYVFLKYGVKKLKWYTISPALVITWAISIAIGILPYFDQFQPFNNNGICRSVTTAPLYPVIVGGASFSAITGSCIIVFFSIISYRYLKKNTLEDNADVKIAVSKNLFYLAVAAVLTTVCQIFPSFSPLIRTILPDYRYLIAYNYFQRIIINFPNIATPIVAIYALKPIQLSMKNAFKKIFKRNNTVAPTPNGLH